MYYNRGGKIISATPANLQAFDKAVEPLYAELEQDPATKAMIDRIRTLKKSVRVPSTGVAAPC
ncbi:hypothetical protein OHA70_04275 [Kribbella sp. NBC_00382]|uniref:hypothetical protein n=1 Tax=Kribbella sp. NBC_00382 TaxID=2975967 RepID=UPI002E2019EE